MCRWINEYLKRSATALGKLKPQWNTASKPLGWLNHKEKWERERERIVSVGEDVEKLETHTLVVGT